MITRPTRAAAVVPPGRPGLPSHKVNGGRTAFAVQVPLVTAVRTSGRPVPRVFRRSPGPARPPHRTTPDRPGNRPTSLRRRPPDHRFRGSPAPGNSHRRTLPYESVNQNSQPPAIQSPSSPIPVTAQQIPQWTQHVTASRPDLADAPPRNPGNKSELSDGVWHRRTTPTPVIRRMFHVYHRSAQPGYRSPTTGLEARCRQRFFPSPHSIPTRQKTTARQFPFAPVGSGRNASGMRTTAVHIPLIRH
jgi:hypothetical protein